jgi:hypothetical protein
MNQDTSVGIATSYRLDGRASNPAKGKIFSVFHGVQTDSEA